MQCGIVISHSAQSTYQALVGQYVKDTNVIHRQYELIDGTN